MLRVIVLFLIVGVLTACGSGGKDENIVINTSTHTEAENSNSVIHVTATPGTPAPTSGNGATISGFAVDDPIANGTIKLYDLNNQLLATTTTDEAGEYSFNYDLNSLSNGYILKATGGTINNGQAFIGELVAIYSLDNDADKANLTIMSTLIAKLAESQAGSNLIEQRNAAITKLENLGLLASNDYHNIDTELLDEDAARIDISVINIQAWVDEIITDIADDELSAANMAAFASANGGVANISILGLSNISIWPGATKQIHIDISSTQNNILSSLENAPPWVHLSDSTITVNPSASVASGNYSFELTAGSNTVSTKKKVSINVEVLERVLLLSGDLTPAGDTISNNDQDISISVTANKLSQNYQVNLFAAATGQDTVKFVLESTPEMPEEERLELEMSTPSSTIIIRNHIEPAIASSNRLQVKAKSNRGNANSSNAASSVPNSCNTSWRDGNNDGYRFNYIWEGRVALFKDLADLLPNGGDPRVFKRAIFGDEDIRCRSTLRSSISWQSPDLHTKEPVLLVHGFIPSGNLGGIDGNEEYFGAFPKVLSQLQIGNRAFLPFLFSWQTNQRFEDAASDLSLAISKIAKETQQQVHIVAHSFGGVLTRTLVQGMAENGLGSNFSTKHIASITTIGTPHSGILSKDSGTTLNYSGHAIDFPHGTDNTPGSLINACKSITCYQVGEDWNEMHDSHSEKTYRVKTESISLPPHTVWNSVKGYLAYELAKDINNYPNIPTQVLLGAIHDTDDIKCLTSGDENCYMTYSFKQGEHMGDGLISLKGQRFNPENAEVHPSLAKTSFVEEHLLNFYNDKSLTRQEMISLSSSFFDNIDYDQSWIYSFQQPVSLKSGSYYPLFSTQPERALLYSQSIHEQGFTSGVNHRTSTYNQKTGVLKLVGNTIKQGSEGGDMSMLTEVGLNERTCSSKTAHESQCEHPSWLYVKSFLALHEAESVAASSQIVVSGKVQQSQQRAARNGLSTLVTVNVYNNNQKVGSQQVAVGESYNVPVAFVANSPYHVEIVPERNSGLRATVSQTINTASSLARSSLNFGIFNLISNALVNNSLNVNVVNAINGQPLTQFDYVVRNYVGAERFRGNENSNSFTVTALRVGLYRIEINKPGYNTEYKTCTIVPAVANECTVVLSPETSSSGALTAVLTWDENPRDLDSHMIKYDSSGDEVYHIYYNRKTVPGSTDNLDLDDTSSYGPETLTIETLESNAHYIYAVHHFSGSGSIVDTSEASVSIQIENDTVTLNAPVSGNGTWWKVFEVINGDVIPCNQDCIVDQQPSLQRNKNPAKLNDKPWLKDMVEDLVEK